MTNECITYKELAVHLKLTEKTVKQHWRYYPHFFVTPASKKSNNLKGARFNLGEIMDYLKETAGSRYHDDTRIYREREQIPSVLQTPRARVQQGVQNKTRGESMGNQKGKGTVKIAEYASDFSVFEYSRVR